MSSIVAPTILVVERDPEVSGLIRQSLEAFIGAEIQITADAEYGFELALRERFDLYLFSLSLGGLEGDQLHRLIWLTGASGHVRLKRIPPVVWLAGSGTSASRIREASRQPGCKGVLRSPFSLDTLVDRVGAALSLGEEWALA